MRFLRSFRACTIRCTLLHARTHILRGGQDLHIVWQVVTQNQTRRLARVVFKVPEISTVLGAPRPSRYGRAVKLELSGEFCNGDRLSLGALWQPLDCFYGLSDGSRHARLHALTYQIDYQLLDGRVVFDGGDDAPPGIRVAAGLVQKCMGSDEVQHSSKVAPQPDRHRRYKIGQDLRVGDNDAMLSTPQPYLEGVPGFEV